MYQTNYSTYLVHFNKNHDSKNGQFTFGDGDADGISDDHSNQKKNRFGMSRGSSNSNNVQKNQSNVVDISSRSNKKQKTPGQQLKSKGTKQMIAGGIGFVASSAAFTMSDDLVVKGAAWVAGLGSAVLFSVGAYNYERGDKQIDIERAINYYKNS